MVAHRQRAVGRLPCSQQRSTGERRFAMRFDRHSKLRDVRENDGSIPDPALDLLDQLVEHNPEAIVRDLTGLRRRQCTAAHHAPSRTSRTGHRRDTDRRICSAPTAHAGRPTTPVGEHEPHCGETAYSGHGCYLVQTSRTTPSMGLPTVRDACTGCWISVSPTGSQLQETNVVRASVTPCTSVPSAVAAMQ